MHASEGSEKLVRCSVAAEGLADGEARGAYKEEEEEEVSDMTAELDDDDDE
jgi:hypothetical protein